MTRTAPHKKNKIIGLIPARMESSRLPNKPLLKILGHSMIVHVAKRAKLSKILNDVVVCTDSIEIAHECFTHNIKCCLTGNYHNNGTERIAEAARIMNLKNDDYIIDIQGDEPLINPETIDNLARQFIKSKFDLMLPYILLKERDNKNIVKIIESNKKIIYMSRADIPLNFSTDVLLKKHLSVIAFTNKSLQLYSKNPKSNLEKIESIELLRAIELGMSIGTFEEKKETFSVDVKEDYEKSIRAMREDDLYPKYR